MWQGVGAGVEGKLENLLGQRQHHRSPGVRILSLEVTYSLTLHNKSCTVVKAGGGVLGLHSGLDGLGDGLLAGSRISLHHFHNLLVWLEDCSFPTFLLPGCMGRNGPDHGVP